MKMPEPNFSVNVDVANSGQFFACCGLLELAHRLWPDVEAWFDETNHRFVMSSADPEMSIQRLVCDLRRCDISGLTRQEHKEQEVLKKEKRNLKKQGKMFSPEKERRRKELETQAQRGALRLGCPFALLLDWWQTGDKDQALLKTWAGQQKVHMIARAAQDALPTDGLHALFDYECVLSKPSKYGKKICQAVEPFYFDARRFAHALDTGFSLDAQDAKTPAHPAVELLSLVGLQRFRPAVSSAKWCFEYWTWSHPLSAPVAAGVSCGIVPFPGRQRYGVQLRFRDDQKRYKAFSFATQLGGDT